MHKKLETLEERIGYSFKDKSLLVLALTHSSHSASVNGSDLSNERMEFLGDRVLGLVIAKMLYIRFPEEAEGKMALRYTALVRKEALSRVATVIDLGCYLELSHSEESSGGRQNPAILADACEALIAAVFLDSGINSAQDVIQLFWEELIKEDPKPPQDNKTALQEWTQANDLGLPKYNVVKQSGPSHAPSFTIELDIAGYPPQQAQGLSKQKAEQAVAKMMLDCIKTTL